MQHTKKDGHIISYCKNVHGCEKINYYMTRMDI